MLKIKPLVTDAISSLCKYLNRDSAHTSQEGRRGRTIGGGAMSDFANVAGKVARDAGVTEEDIIIPYNPMDKRTVLPGYFRPTKNWDFLIVQNKIPLVALEFKSIMSSFGNNLNNRAEEAVGQGTDLNAFMEANGLPHGSIFSGYLMIMADDRKSSRATRPVILDMHDFPVEMNGLSYQQRADRMCQRLEDDGVWTCTSFATTVPNLNTGDFSLLSESNSPVRFYKEMHKFLKDNYLR